MMNQTLQVKTKCICRQDALQIQCTWVLHDIKCRYMILRYCSDAAFQLTPAGFCAHIAKKKRIMPTDRTFFLLALFSLSYINSKNTHCSAYLFTCRLSNLLYAFVSCHPLYWFVVFWWRLLCIAIPVCALILQISACKLSYLTMTKKEVERSG